jgi:hypothetical protein
MSLSVAFALLNWWAIMVAGIVHVVVSLVWFQPVFFGRAWTRLSGRDLAPAVPWIPAGLAAHFVCVLALAVIVRLAGATTVLEGVVVGVFVSVCFIGAVLAGELVWEKIPFRLFLIRFGDQVFTAGIAGAILAAWR